MEKYYLGAQVLIIAICGSLIALGEDSLITNLFVAGCGSILGVAGYQRLNK